MSNQTAEDTALLKDGQALDRLTERAENWAKSYGNLTDEAAWDTDFTAKFASQARSFAEQCTPAARKFTARDWVLAIVLWLIISSVVFVGSVFLMSLSGTWTIVFLIFAALIALVGIWQSYLETSSEARAAKKTDRKEQWLLAVSRKAAIAVLRKRQALKAAKG